MKEVEETIEEAEEEFKRTDHMLHVTIKYTRSSGVVKNILKQFISVFDLSTKAILKEAKKIGKIKEIPEANMQCYELMEKLFSKDKEVKNLIKFYRLLKKIDRSEYTVVEEYRKHLTIQTGKIDVNVAMLEDYFQKTKDYFKFAKDYVEA